ncbi:MAG: hypothetical protein QM501_09370 [Gimesia sp.]
MPIVQFSTGEQIAFDGEKATIGSSSTNTIVIRDDSRVVARHAVIKKVAGRWMVESTSESLLSTNQTERSRLCWLEPDDRIRLTEEGPELVFSTNQIIASAIAPTPEPKSPAPQTTPSEQPQPTPQPSHTPAVSQPVPTEVTNVKTDPAVSPHSGPPITINVSGNPAGANSMLLWFGGGIVLLILVLFAFLFYILGRPDGQTVENQRTPLAEANEGTNNSFRTNSRQAAQLQPEQTVYAVFVQERQSQIFLRIGTATAISKNQLVTSGSVGAFIERNIEQYPVIQVHAISDNNLIFPVIKTGLLPEYQQQIDTSTELANEIRQLQESVEQQDRLPSQQELSQIGAKMGSLKDRMFQTIEQLVCLDVAMLEVQGELPTFLSLAENLPALNKELTILGAPFTQDETEYLPGETKLTSMKNQGFLIRFQDLGKASLKRMVVKCKQVDLDHNWTGSALLNSKNEIVGVYSRPAPGKDLTKPPTGDLCDVPTTNLIRKLKNSF